MAARPRYQVSVYRTIGPLVLIVLVGNPTLARPVELPDLLHLSTLLFRHENKIVDFKNTIRKQAWLTRLVRRSAQMFSGVRSILRSDTFFHQLLLTGVKMSTG